MEREKDYDWVLLTAVMLFSVAIAGVVALFEPTPAVAATKPPTYLVSQEPVRVIVPFTPNTTPSER